MATFTSWTWTEHMLFEFALVQFPEGSPYSLENISQFLQKPIAEVKYFYDALVNDIELIESDKVALPNYPEDDYLPFNEEAIPKSKTPAKKRGIPWTREEHELFLVGLKKYGKGDWKSISRECVKTRTSTQVASHAQKYFLRQNSDSKERKRTSIHDIPLKDNGNDVTNVPDGSSSQSKDQQQQSLEELNPEFFDYDDLFDDDNIFDDDDIFDVYDDGSFLL